MLSEAYMMTMGTKFTKGNRNRISLWGIKECMAKKGTIIQMKRLLGRFMVRTTNENKITVPIGKNGKRKIKYK